MENTAHPNKDMENEEETASSAQQAGVDANDTADPKSQIKKLQDELTDAKDKYLRLYAEFDNHRRRTSREKIDMIQSANENLIKLLLPVVDDFDRAEKSFKDKNDKASEGFFLIQNKFKKILENAGVKWMVTEPASDFDPEFHDAITQIPAPTENLKGKIMDVVERGYLLNDKVIRHAKVVVGN